MKIDDHLALLFLNTDLGTKFPVSVIEILMGKILFHRNEQFSVIPQFFRRFPLVLVRIRVDGG